MSRWRSPIMGKRYPLRTVCDVWRVPRSSVYALTAATRLTAKKRRPKTAQNDLLVVERIRAILATSPFHSEGHRKVRVRLRQRGIHVGKARVLRLMRGHGLLAPTRPGHVHGHPAHAGRATTHAPTSSGGPDATCFWTAADGWCWGPQYTAHAFGAELRWLGIQHSPSFVGAPQCNGVIERFMRTLKAQCLWLRRFRDLAHAEREIAAFIERYNQEWLFERHGHCTPPAAPAKMRAAA